MKRKQTKGNCELNEIHNWLTTSEAGNEQESVVVGGNLQYAVANAISTEING